MADNLTNTDNSATQYITANNFDVLKSDLNRAFNNIISKDFYKGAKGDSVKITSVSLKDSDTKLNTEGEKVYAAVFGDDTAVTDARVAAIPKTWNSHPATPLFFVYNETADDNVFTDYSCIVYATEIDASGDGYSYKKVDGFPTIYYNSSLKDYCWKVSGVETEISARYKNTSDKHVQFFLLKKDDAGVYHYWDTNKNTWVDTPSDVSPVIGDYAYVLSKKTVTVAETDTDALALGFAVYDSSGWKEITYGDDLTAVTYSDAYMQYIWKSIYSSLGQEYPTESNNVGMDETVDSNKSFHLPDVTTDGEYFHNITAISNSERSDIVITPKDYGDTRKEHAVIFDGYTGVYTKGRDTGPDDEYKLVTKTELEAAAVYIDLNSDDYMPAKTYKKVKVISSTYPDMVIYMDLSAKPANTLMNMSLPGIAVINNELFDVKYNIHTDTITWMKDQYGNEASWDFVHEMTFVYNGGGDDLDCRSRFRNTVFKATNDGVQDMRIYIKNTNTNSPSTILIPSTYIIGKNNVFDNCMNTNGLSTLTVYVDSTQSEFPNEIICNNVVTNSKLNITLGINTSADESTYGLYNSSDTELSRCMFSNNVITNSVVTLSAYRMSDNTIINSSINGINTAWLYLPSTAVTTDASTSPTYEGCNYEDSKTDIRYQRQIKYVCGTSAVAGSMYRSALYNLRSIDHNKFIGFSSNIPIAFVAKGISTWAGAKYTGDTVNDLYTITNSTLISNFKVLIQYNHDLCFAQITGYNNTGYTTSTLKNTLYSILNKPIICIDNGTDDGIQIAVIGCAAINPSGTIVNTNMYLQLPGQVTDLTAKTRLYHRNFHYSGPIVNICGSNSTTNNDEGYLDLIIGSYISKTGNMLHMASWNAYKSGLTILQ